MTIEIADIKDANIITLVQMHGKLAAHDCDPCANHAMNMQGFKAENITLYCHTIKNTPVSLGALRIFNTKQGELKTMFTLPEHRGKGFGTEMLQHLFNCAKEAGLKELYLETGRWGYFASAQRLYSKFEFSPCPAFGDYPDHPDSMFMHCSL